MSTKIFTLFYLEQDPVRSRTVRLIRGVGLQLLAVEQFTKSIATHSQLYVLLLRIFTLFYPEQDPVRSQMVRLIRGVGLSSSMVGFLSG